MAKNQKEQKETAPEVDVEQEQAEQDHPEQKQPEKVCVEFNRSYQSYFPGDKAGFPADVAETLCAGTDEKPAIAVKVK